jgi:hypothetical protein
MDLSPGAPARTIPGNCLFPLKGSIPFDLKVMVGKMCNLQKWSREEREWWVCRPVRPLERAQASTPGRREESAVRRDEEMVDVCQGY